MCVPCSANKCRIRESDLQAACLYIIFLNGYKLFWELGIEGICWQMFAWHFREYCECYSRVILVYLLACYVFISSYAWVWLKCCVRFCSFSRYFVARI